MCTFKDGVKVEDCGLVESWKDVVGYEGLYAVSTKGRLYSYRRDKIMSPALRDGYLRAAFTDAEGEVKNICVHTAMWLTFMGSIPEGYQIRHLDTHMENMCLMNLAYGTNTEQWGDFLQSGKQRKKPVRLGKDCAFNIAVSTLSHRALSRKHCVAKGTIDDIRRARHYSEITAPLKALREMLSQVVGRQRAVDLIHYYVLEECIRLEDGKTVIDRERFEQLHPEAGSFFRRGDVSTPQRSILTAVL